MFQCTSAETPYNFLQAVAVENLSQLRLIQVPNCGPAFVVDTAQGDITGMKYGEVVSHPEAIAVIGGYHFLLCKGVSPVG